MKIGSKWAFAIGFSCMGVNGAEAVLASLKGLGMGGACVSYPLDSGVMAYNPAGIVDLCNRVDVAVYPVYTRGSATIRDNVNSRVNRISKNSAHWMVNPEIGTIYHVHPKVALGLLFFNEKDLRVKYHHSFPLVGTTPLGFEYTLQILNGTLAVKPFQNHSFSFSVNYLGQRAALKGVQVLANTYTPFSEHPDYVTNKGYNYTSGWGVMLGWRGNFLNERLNFGLSWRPKTAMTRLSDYKGFIVQRGKLDIPESFRAGFSFSPFASFTFAIDYQLLKYNSIPAFNHSFNLLSPHLLGSGKGSAFGWTNQHSFRLGVQYDYCPCLSFRAGYRFANSNFKGGDLIPNLLTLDTTVDFLTCGTTWLITNYFEISALFVWGFNSQARAPISSFFGGGSVKLEQEVALSAVSMAWYY